MRSHPVRAALPAALALAAALLFAPVPHAGTQARGPAVVTDPAALVDTRIGTAGGGNVFPGAVVPFGMVQWSPETTRGDSTRAAAPGGYAYDAPTVRGFSLTHLSGTGCRGASGDIPFMPYVGTIRTSPSADTTDRVYTSRLSHANEIATPGFYQVRLGSGVKVELTATARTGAARFTFPKGTANAHLLVRASDSEVGSSDAQVTVDPAAKTITGSVTSGNFCGYLGEVNRRSYYTLHFFAVFDRAFTSTGAWENKELKPGATTAKGGTTYGTDGYPVAGTGSGAWVGFDAADGAPIDVRVGISYVSLANAEANLRAEGPPATPFDAVKGLARSAWSSALRRVQISGGSARHQRIFYTALYHSLLHPNLFSDVNGEYWGLDQKAHAVAPPQKAQYANFSGWDVYRSQVQLVTLLEPAVASDIAQSLLNQAEQYGGVWDRWTHNSGATHVMEGDASAAAVASMYAFGADAFDVKRAFASLVKAATVPTKLDLSDEGCRVACVGQRPSLDRWLTIKYIPTVSNAWGGAGETLEDVSADFALAQLAHRLGDTANAALFLDRSDYWRNLFNPKATPDRGYIQNRNADGTFPPFDPASSAGFAEGSSAQYTWMIPFNPRGLFVAMGGTAPALARLDEFFHNDDGSWALTRLGGLKAEMDNEPSIGTPWLYSFAGRPDRTQATVRAAMTHLWNDTPHGIPGNDDLGAMSSWYVWSAIGMYPNYPGRAELLLASPLFPRIVIARGNGKTIAITAPEADPAVMYVHALRVNNRPSTRAWLPESFVTNGGTLEFRLMPTASETWGRAAADLPPSFAPGAR